MDVDPERCRRSGVMRRKTSNGSDSRHQKCRIFSSFHWGGFNREDHMCARTTPNHSSITQKLPTYLPNLPHKLYSAMTPTMIRTREAGCRENIAREWNHPHTAPPYNALKLHGSPDFSRRPASQPANHLGSQPDDVSGRGFRLCR